MCSPTSESTQSYGLADRLLNQAAIMVMAVSEITQFLGSSQLNFMQAFYNPGPNGIEVWIFLWSVSLIITHFATSQFIGRVPDVTAPTARYPYEVTLHQGEIESLFLDSMRKEGLQVERPVVPTSLQISEDPKEVADPHAYPVKVWPFRLALLSFK